MRASSMPLVVLFVLVGCGARSEMEVRALDGGAEDAFVAPDAFEAPDAFVPDAWSQPDSGPDAWSGYDSGMPCATVATESCPNAVARPSTTCAADPDTGVTCSRELVLSFVPTAHAQIAAWAHACSGQHATLMLTDATATHGIGNRPGALQMGSGYRFPAGRRENVLPVWARERLESGASAFPRVVHRSGDEGLLSNRFVADGYADTQDRYFCLGFSPQLSLDAVSCASMLTYDKGRYATCDDVAAGLVEPFETAPGVGTHRVMPAWSAYPPRRDVIARTGDHPDVTHYASDAQRAFPEVDAVSFATPAAGTRVERTWAIPDDWSAGTAVVSVEVNLESDDDDRYAPALYPNPSAPAGEWDGWSQSYRPYRGQPSVVFDVVIEVPPLHRFAAPARFSATAPTRMGSLDGSLCSSVLDGVVDDPVAHPGSGADRLRLVDGARVQVEVRQVCR